MGFWTVVFGIYGGSEPFIPAGPFHAEAGIVVDRIAEAAFVVDRTPEAGIVIDRIAEAGHFLP